jgi:transposase
VAWNTANDAVLAEGRRVLIEDPHRFDGVRVIGVDEHCWRHTRRGDKYVTVIIDLTPIRDGTGPARLLDMVEGRSKQVFKAWLGERDTSWRDCVEVVAMDGFTGALFAVSEHVEVEATWGIYQRMIAAYREPDKKHGKAMMQAVIDSVASGVPATLSEIRKLGRTLKQRATDILAFFDRPGTSNGPTEAINGRLEHLRGSAPGFRNLTNYIARSLLEAGGFRPRLHPRLR